MLTLIAESKTMLDDQQIVSAQTLENHTPAGEKQASEIMEALGRLSQPELLARTGFSPSLAAKLRQMIYEFPNKSLGLKAIEAYTGVVFKALKYATLSPREQMLCNRNVRVISSLYGLLRPDDIIKPYRLDYTTKAAPSDKALNSFWKTDVTIRLVKDINREGRTQLINLLPADAAKCIDWKVVKRFCKVWKVDFAEVTDGGQTKTPTANKLKTMRGLLLRHILRDGIATVADLRAVISDDFICEGTPVYPDHLLFLC